MSFSQWFSLGCLAAGVLLLFSAPARTAHVLSAKDVALQSQQVGSAESEKLAVEVPTASWTTTVPLPHWKPTRGQIDSGAPARPAWKAEAFARKTGKSVIAGDEWRKRPVLGNARIHPPENAGVTRPKLPNDPGHVRVSLVRTGASRRRDFAGGRETSCTLVAEQSAHLSGVPEVATVNGTRQGTAASGVSIGGDEPLARCSEGWSPSRSAHRIEAVRRQQQESATRLASEALSVSGRAAAQPDLIGGVS